MKNGFFTALALCVGACKPALAQKYGVEFAYKDRDVVCAMLAGCVQRRIWLPDIDRELGPVRARLQNATFTGRRYPATVVTGFTDLNCSYDITASQLWDSAPDLEESDTQPLPTAALFPDIFRPA